MIACSAAFIGVPLPLPHLAAASQGCPSTPRSQRGGPRSRPDRSPRPALAVPSRSLLLPRRHHHEILVVVKICMDRMYVKLRAPALPHEVVGHPDIPVVFSRDPTLRQLVI